MPAIVVYRADFNPPLPLSLLLAVMPAMVVYRADVDPSLPPSLYDSSSDSLVRPPSTAM